MSTCAMKYYSMDLRDLRKLCMNKSLTGITRSSNRQQCINSLTSNKKPKPTKKSRSISKHSRKPKSHQNKNRKSRKINKFKKEEKEEENTDIILENYLKSWKLGQYINILISEQGYDDINDWNDLTLLELQSMGFKPGHSKKFKRKTNEYFVQKRKLRTASTKHPYSTDSALRNIPTSTQTALNKLNYSPPALLDLLSESEEDTKPKYFNKLNHTHSNDVDFDDEPSSQSQSESHSESEGETSPIYHRSPSKSQSHSNANTRKSTSDMIASIAKPQYHEHIHKNNNVNVTPNVPIEAMLRTQSMNEIDNHLNFQDDINGLTASHSHSQSQSRPTSQSQSRSTSHIDTVKHITYYIIIVIISIVVYVALLYGEVGRDIYDESSSQSQSHSQSEYEVEDDENGNLMFAISKMTHYEPAVSDNIPSSNDGDGNREGNSNLFRF